MTCGPLVLTDLCQIAIFSLYWCGDVILAILFVKYKKINNINNTRGIQYLLSVAVHCIKRLLMISTTFSTLDEWF